MIQITKYKNYWVEEFAVRTSTGNRLVRERSVSFDHEFSFTIGTKGFINPMNLRFDIRVEKGVIYEDLYDGDELLSTTVHGNHISYCLGPWCRVKTDHQTYILITRCTDNKSITIDWNESIFNEMKTIFSKENT